jgi:hypothetical protein
MEWGLLRGELSLAWHYTKRVQLPGDLWKERREAMRMRRREGGQEKIRGTESSMTGTGLCIHKTGDTRESLNKPRKLKSRRVQNAGERYAGAVTRE